jgi:carbon monoxide dehydrogenase subunit G
MQLTSQQTLPASQAQAWEALNDTAILQACIPGCESLIDVGEGRYELAIQAAIGPVKARFKGKLALANLQPPTAYEIQFEGQGGAAGHGKGWAQVRLEPQGPAQTVLHYAAQASVGGKLAQLGQRLVDMAAQRMAAEFFSKFTTQLSERYPAPAQPSAPAMEAPSPSPSLWARLCAWFARLVRREAR